MARQPHRPQRPLPCAICLVTALCRLVHLVDVLAPPALDCQVEPRPGSLFLLRRRLLLETCGTHLRGGCLCGRCRVHWCNVLVSTAAPMPQRRERRTSCRRCCRHGTSAMPWRSSHPCSRPCSCCVAQPQHLEACSGATTCVFSSYYGVKQHPYLMCCAVPTINHLVDIARRCPVAAVPRFPLFFPSTHPHHPGVCECCEWVCWLESTAPCASPAAGGRC